MNITVNFEGLNKIFCKLGIHRWQKDEYASGSDQITDYKHPIIKFCLDCGWEVRKK